MKYLFCLPRYHTNAVPWVRILKAAGHEVVIDVVEQGATESHTLLSPSIMAPSKVSRMMMRRGSSNVANSPNAFPSLTAYWRRLRAENPDVVIVRGVTRWFSRVAAACALAQGRRLVIYDQEDAHPAAWSSTWLRRAAFRRIGVPHVTVRLPLMDSQPSAGSALSLPFGCPFDHALAADLSRRPLQWPARILMIAKYRERKGHSSLLEALATIAKSTPFSLTFCGEIVTASDAEFCKTLREKAESLGIGERVHFSDSVSHDEISTLYARHDLFILPSSFESAAVSPIEAAWAGCAVLMSRDSGTRGYIPHGPEYDFRAGEPFDIARAVAGVLAGPDQLHHARDSCFSHISAVAGEHSILQIFESLAPTRNRYQDKYTHQAAR